MTPVRRVPRINDTSVRTVCAHDCPDACSIVATVHDGRLIDTVGDPQHPFTRGFLCAKVRRYSARVYSPERLLTPLRRTGPKGSGLFTAIGWEAALDEICDRWTTIRRQFGNESILGYAYSAHQGLINRNFTQALFHALGGTRANVSAVCDTCCGEAWNLTVGAGLGTDPERVVDSDLVICWGANLDHTNVHLLPFVEDARRRGARLVVIDVWRTKTARRADMFVPIRVATDAALALGIAHVLVRDSLVDRDYVEHHTLGFHKWREEVLPRFPPRVVEELTGVPAASIEELARAYGFARAPFVRLGQALSRHSGGGNAVRAIVALTGLVGAWRHRGGGALLSTADAFNFNYDAVRRPDLEPHACRTVNMVRFGHALTEWDEPPLKALFVQSNNPAVTCPDQARVRRGLARDDLFTVVHDTFMSDTARYADLVLPASTSFESEDLYRTYGAYYVQYGQQVIEPVGESWSNQRLIATLAQRLGLTDPVFRRTPREHMAALLDVTDGPLADIQLDDLLSGEPHRLQLPDSGHSFEEGFPTPSGRLQIACPELAEHGLPDLPDYAPPTQRVDGALRLVIAPGRHQHHTSFAGVPSLREREGEPRARLHPEEAARHAVEDGDVIELANERGEVTLHATLTADVPKGLVVVVGLGAQTWYVSGGPLNRLSGSELSDVGEGATYQDTWVKVRKIGIAGEFQDSCRLKHNHCASI